ncbi:MAG: discoidin domain-containing protein [Clostridia bacterium]|nr:discoidin domain-containing protein [Clostridia bacterium]
MKRDKTFRSVFIPLLLTAFLLSLPGCGGEPQITDGTDDITENTMESTENTTTAAQETEPAEEPDVFPQDGKNIEIGIFWEPPYEFTNGEQYDRIRDANITFIEITNREGAVSREAADLQRKLARERGIKVTVQAGAYGKGLTKMTDAELTAFLDEMKKDEAVGGVFITDEPADPWNYAKVYSAISKSGLQPHLNLLPYFATWVFDNYNGYVEDTVISVGKEDFGYLTYDQYPFPYGGGDPDMFYNLDLFRKVGLKYGVDTGFYVQSIGENGNFRRTNGGEIRYHTSAGLAYGLESLTYFTWWTTGFCDERDYAIISPYGEKTSIYDDVAEINGDILKVGRLLYRLDALEVYHTYGRESAITKCKAEDVPLYAEKQGRYGLIVSLMEDRETGRDYIMLVNKNYKKDVTYELDVSDKITALYDCTGGEYEKADISSGRITVDFKAGGFALFAVGKNDDIVRRTPDTDINLAKDKPVAVERTYPGGGYYAYTVTDGNRESTDNTAKGYKSKADTGYVEVDLGRAVAIDRVDIYPTGTKFTRGQTFPAEYRVTVSEDGENYTEVGHETSPDRARREIPSFRFGPVNARYVRFEALKGCATGGFEVAEIEIYGGGDVPEPDNASLYSDPGNPADGTDLAGGKPVTVSSELGGDWAKEHITDGDRGTNWSSALNRHKTEDGVEWIKVDLLAPLEFNTVELYPRGDGAYYPYALRVETSEDGAVFTPIGEFSADEVPVDHEPFVCSLDKTYRSRYVRIYAYRLRDVSGFNDGHLFQLSELEIYNRK